MYAPTGPGSKDILSAAPLGADDAWIYKGQRAADATILSAGFTNDEKLKRGGQRKTAAPERFPKLVQQK